MFNRSSKNQSRRVPHPDQTQKTTPYSYYANRSSNLEQKKREKPRIEERTPISKSLFWNHVVTFILLIIIVAGAVDILWLSTSPRVIELKSSGANSTVLLRASSIYQAEAELLLKSSFLNRNKLTINIAGITSGLEKNFPELANATVTLPLGGHQISIYVQPAPPVLLLNNGVGGSFLLNSQGIAIGAVNAKNQKNVSSLNLPSVQYPNYKPQLDQRVLSSPDVAFATYVFDELEAQHVTIQSMTLQGTNRELDVYITGAPYFVKFNLEASSKEQVGALVDIRQYLSQNKITPSQYIDVRIVGRAYYK